MPSRTQPWLFDNSAVFPIKRERHNIKAVQTQFDICYHKLINLFLFITSGMLITSSLSLFMCVSYKMAATKPHNITIKCGKKIASDHPFFLYIFWSIDLEAGNRRVIIFVYHMITKVLSKGMQFYIYGLIITLLPHISLLVPNFPNPNPSLLPLSFFSFFSIYLCISHSIPFTTLYLTSTPLSFTLPSISPSILPLPFPSFLSPPYLVIFLGTLSFPLLSPLLPLHRHLPHSP